MRSVTRSFVGQSQRRLLCLATQRASVVLALSTCGLTANVAVGVTARSAAGVSIRAAVRAAARAATRAAARADAKAAVRNKPMRLIGSQLLSQLSVA